MGVGEAAKDSKLMDGAIADLAAITGQKPQGDQGEEVDRPVQVCARANSSAPHVTLRRRPHVGVPRSGFCRSPSLAFATSVASTPVSFGRARNTTPFGLTEQSSSTRSTRTRSTGCAGWTSTIVTTATTDEGRGRALLQHLGFPFKEK